jgi:hypothetical protein
MVIPSIIQWLCVAVSACRISSVLGDKTCDDNTAILPSLSYLKEHRCSHENLEGWLSPDYPLRGYHVLCVGSLSKGTGTREVLSFSNGLPTEIPLKFSLREGSNWEKVRNEIAQRLSIARHVDPWYDADHFFQLCRNQEERCQEWASVGECEANPAYM